MVGKEEKVIPDWHGSHDVIAKATCTAKRRFRLYCNIPILVKKQFCYICKTPKVRIE